MTFLITWLLLTAAFVAVNAWAALRRPMCFLYLLPFTALVFATGIYQLADSQGLLARLALALLAFCLGIWATVRLCAILTERRHARTEGNIPR